MPKGEEVYAGHMLDTARLALTKTQGKTRDDYDKDENLRLALTYLVQTLGEAARRTSSTFRDAHSEIPWSRVIGMRSKIVHDYLDVDYDIVWDVVTIELPGLIRALEKIVPDSTR